MMIPVVSTQGGDFLKIAPEQLVVMRRYLTLLFNTHTHVAVKLSETTPIGANSPVVRFQNLHAAYARLLAASYFRLPNVGRLIVEACSLDKDTLDKLWDFSGTFPQAANANISGAELPPSSHSSSKEYRSPGNPKLGRSASASSMLQKPVVQAPSLSPPRQRAVVPAALPSASPPSGAPAPSPMLSRVRREFSPPSGISNIEQEFVVVEPTPVKPFNRNGMQVASAEEIAEMESKLFEQRKQLLQREAELVARNELPTIEIVAATSSSTDSDDADSITKSITIVTVVSEKPSSRPPSPVPPRNQTPPPYAISAPTSVLDIPPLFSWCKLHATLIKSDHSRLSGSWNEAPRRKWLPWFQRGESALFIIFVREWIAHVQAMIDRTRSTRLHLKMTDSTADFKWNLVEGFQQLVQAFLFNLRQYDRPSKVLMDTTKALIACDPALINFFLKHVYYKTNIYNMDLVNNLFTKLDVWFTEFDRLEQPLPASFDASFFCSGMELLIDLDHHQLTSRILAFVFANAALLVGDVRRTVLYEFFLKKYFFRLFLHWDDVVRNYFHQLLIYRMVRIPRSHLAEAGFHAPEIAVLGASTSSLNGASRVQQLSSEEDLLDMKLFTNISAYVRTVEDQLRCPDTSDPTFARALEIYAPKALAEYRYYLSRYEENDSTPKLIPLHMLQEKKLPPGVKAQPVRTAPKATAEDTPT